MDVGNMYNGIQEYKNGGEKISCLRKRKLNEASGKEINKDAIGNQKLF